MSEPTHDNLYHQVCDDDECSFVRELTRLRAIEEAAMDVVAADLIDNVWLRDKWIPALRAALREKGVEEASPS